MNLLPFNLEEALKQPDRVVYRNGEKPLEWHHFDKMINEYKVLSIKTGGNLIYHLIDGSFNRVDNNHELDLFLLPLPEKRYWASVYEIKSSPGSIHLVLGTPYSSEEEALSSKKISNYIKTISFTI